MKKRKRISPEVAEKMGIKPREKKGKGYPQYLLTPEQLDQYNQLCKGEKLTSSTHQHWVILFDVHRPFHDKILWDKVLQFIKDSKPFGIVIAGDFLDLYTLGSYNAESLGLLRDIDLEFEYLDGLKAIKELEDALPKTAIRKFLFGNHEDRYFRTMNHKDNAKFGAALKNPVNALHLDKYKYEVKTNWKDDYFTLGDHLDIMHGVYTNIHAAKKHLDMHGRSCAFGHTHRVQMFRHGAKAAYNGGGLFDLGSNGFNYMPRMQRDVWCNGFANVYIDNHGDYYYEQVNIWGKKFFTHGKEY